MTFLGLERPVEYQRQQIFDPTTANMVLSAQSDYVNAVYNDYLRGLEDMKEFNKTYGDFMSPIQKDMDWYDKNVTGKVRDFITNAYAQGIDPLRSAEGRAAVAQLIYSMPTGDIAKVRQSAETAKEYLKSFDDDTNPELEKFLGRDLSSWSTLGDPANGISPNGVWGASKTSKYQDLNQYTTHIFDNLKDSYIGTDKNHYDWYGVTENDLYKSLTPDKLGGLLNTSLGQFHYQNAIKDLAAQGITNPTEAQKMEQFRKNIVAANHERVHQDRKLNDLWKMQQENAARRSSGRGSSTTATEPIIGWTDRQKFNVMVSNVMKNKEGAAKSFNDYIKNKKNLNASGSLTVKGNLRQLISDYYNSTMADIEEYDIATANAEFNKGGRQENYNDGTGTSRKRTIVSFENKQIRPTAYAEVQWAGKTLTKGSYTRTFAEYLQKNKIEGESVGTPTINHQPGSRGDLYEINRRIRVPLTKLQEWIDKHPDNWQRDFEEMGISKIHAMQKDYKTGELPKAIMFNDVDYVEIPSSRRINEQGTGNAAIDTGDDKRQLGASAATKRQQYYINRDIRRYGKE